MTRGAGSGRSNAEGSSIKVLVGQEGLDCVSSSLFDCKVSAQGGALDVQSVAFLVCQGGSISRGCLIGV